MTDNKKFAFYIQKTSFGIDFNEVETAQIAFRSVLLLWDKQKDFIFLRGGMTPGALEFAFTLHVHFSIPGNRKNQESSTQSQFFYLNNSFASFRTCG